MGCIFKAVKQAYKFTKEHLLENGPTVSTKKTWTISIM
jgi:hypothetical protein